AEWPDDVDFDTPTEPADADPSRTGENQEAAGDDVVKDQPASADDTKAKTPRRSKKTDPKENFPLALWENIGVTHPILVHFPVALLIGGALFAIFGFRGDSPLGDAAYYCLWLAAWTGILASIVGWSYAEYYHRHGATWDELDFSKTIVLHRWLGILLSILTFVLALIARSSRLNDPYATGALWKLGMVVLAALCGFVGHLGGDLTHKGEVKRAMRNLGLIQEENQRQQPAEPKTTEEENDGDATNKESDSEHGEHQGENQGDNEDNEARANLRKNGLSDGLHNSAYVPTI
ncbi:MAG TPA: hypothetical protein PKD64_19925, partial [Pirellulaceae bacterium]|nr:hypothetical protein [Pirellulaceae bacterium]